MTTPCAKKFQKILGSELSDVVHALAGKFNFDAAEAILFIKSGAITRKVTVKKGKLTPEAKVARALARAAIAKATKAGKLAVKEKAKATKLAVKEQAKATKLAAKEEAKAIKLAEKDAIKLAKLADKAAAKAAKQAERDAAKAVKQAERDAAKAVKDAEKAVAKEVKAIAKLTAKLFGLDEQDGDLKKRADECKSSDQLKELITVVKAELRAKKKRETQIRKLAEKRTKLIAEIRKFASRCGGGINFSENELETADMDGLKEIRKTVQKCIRKLERADQKACAESERRVDNAKFEGQMGLSSILG